MQSRTRFVIHMNMSLVNWYSKKQSTIETSVFKAEFVVMKVGVETLHAAQYKIRMMGIPIYGLAYIYGDNMSVIHYTSKPELTHERNCNAIAYHDVHESVVMQESLIGHIKLETIQLTYLPR